MKKGGGTTEDSTLLQALPGALLPWYRLHARTLPWRQDREPYHVWLSEIMLQQTRVEAVKGYYARFLQELPDIASLAAADPDRLNKLWEGLGYYSRVRNLQTAARQIMGQFGGRFPSRIEDIRSLKGVGDYTAGAIASICFDLPEPAVDGNVLRVVSRITEEFRPVTDAAVRREITCALRQIYPPEHCGEFTQSLMELGATVCVPNGAPDCDNCPVRSFCRAGAAGTWRQLPVKAAKKERRQEKLTVFVLCCDGAYAVRKRPSGGLLAGLWEFPNVPGHLSAQEALTQAERWGVHPRQLLKQLNRTHIFTHVQWDMRCWYFQCAKKPPDFVWVQAAQLQTRIALPTAFRMFREPE